jgi:adhesin transport system outer membrane protein
MRNKVLCLISLLPFLVPAATAQEETPEPAPSQCFRFEEALDIATRIDPRVEGAKAERDLAAANFVGALSQTRPQINAFAQLGEGDGLLQNNQSDNEVGFQIRQNLYSFGAFKLSQIGAREQLKASEHNIHQVKEDVAQEIATAYLELLRASAIVKIAQEQEDYYKEDALTADLRLDGQIITLSEASQIKANYALATSQRIDAVLSRDSAKRRLAILLDTPVDCADEPTTAEYFTDTEDMFAEATLDTLIAQATSSAPAIRSSRARVNAARAATEESRRAGLPIVSLSGFVAYEYEEDVLQPDFTRDDEFQQENRIGLNVTSQIFSGGQNAARRQDARARLRGANSDAASIRAFIEDNVSRAWIRVQSQKDARRVLADARENLKAQLEATELEYEAGRRSLTDVVRAAESYYATASQESNLKYQYYNNLMLLRSNVDGIAH